MWVAVLERVTSQLLLRLPSHRFNVTNRHRRGFGWGYTLTHTLLLNNRLRKVRLEPEVKQGDIVGATDG